MTTSIIKPTYYEQFIREDGSITPKKKIYSSMFISKIIIRRKITYIVVKESKRYQTGEVVYTLKRYKSSGVSMHPDNYIRYKREDGTLTKAKKIKDYLHLGDVYRRFGIVPYVVVSESELGYRSSVYTLERY